ncbi:MAG: competence protein CoiA family protein [Spirochaetaceae bacterium]|nr:competence protein CoiA family protein [Spirochaetaceae bacterium]
MKYALDYVTKDPINAEEGYLGDFRCPHCYKIVHFRREGEKIAHFYHQIRNPDCPFSSEGESLDHWERFAYLNERLINNKIMLDLSSDNG